MRGTHTKRKRRLAQYGGHHAFVHHQRQCEVAGQAHTNGPDAGATALRVGVPAKRAQPIGDRAGLVLPEHQKFPADARPGHLPDDVWDAERLVGLAEEVREIDGKALVGDPTRKTGDLGRNTGNLVHHHDAGARSAGVHPAGRAVVSKFEIVETFE